MSAPTAPATTLRPSGVPGSSGCVALGDLTAPTPRWLRRWGRRPVVAGLAGVAVRVHGGGGRGARPPARRLGRPGPARFAAAGRVFHGRLRRLPWPRRELRQLGGGPHLGRGRAGSHPLPPTAGGGAAAGTTVTVPTILDTSDPVLHLLRRTTFGLTPELVVGVHAAGICAWLAAQLEPATLPDPQSDAAWAAIPSRRPIRPRSRRRCPAGSSDAARLRQRRPSRSRCGRRARLFEVVVDFWANHLNVPTPGPRSWDVGERTTVTSSGPRWARSPTCSWLLQGATRRCSGT